MNEQEVSKTSEEISEKENENADKIENASMTNETEKRLEEPTIKESASSPPIIDEKPTAVSKKSDKEVNSVSEEKPAGEESVEKKPTVVTPTPKIKDDKESPKKKINKMNLKELNTAIEKTKKHMQGLTSRYGRELLKQKEILEKK